MSSPANPPDRGRSAMPDLRPAGVAWQREEIADAGVSIDRHPRWATLREPGRYYQRFSEDGTVSVRWGPDATIDELLRHLGLGTGGSRVVETDETTRAAGLPARRVRVRATGPPAEGPIASGDPVRLFAFTGVTVGANRVLVGYGGPESEIATFAPLLEHVVASVRRLPGGASAAPETRR